MDPLLQARKRAPKSFVTPPTSSGSDVEKEKKILRFLGSGFRYNKRLAIALAPGLLALLLHGGSP